MKITHRRVRTNLKDWQTFSNTTFQRIPDTVYISTSQRRRNRREGCRRSQPALMWGNGARRHYIRLASYTLKQCSILWIYWQEGLELELFHVGGCLGQSFARGAGREREVTANGGDAWGKGARAEKGGVGRGRGPQRVSERLDQQYRPWSSRWRLLLSTSPPSPARAIPFHPAPARGHH